MNSRLKHMKDMKLKFLNDLCKETANNNEGVTKEGVLKNITTAVQEKANDAHKKYSESSFNMSPEDFVKMLILDGSFIVKFFVLNSLERDLLLFENQIPFFIFETIFGCCFSQQRDITLLNHALSYFSEDKITLQMLPNKYWMGEKPEKIHHLLHLSHICLVWPENHVDETLLRNLSTKFIHETPRMLSTIPNATRLREYEIKFRMKKIRGNYDTFLDVSFKDGIMEIPHLDIYDDTASKFRNLLALEQSCEKYGSKLTRYMSFMDDLVDKDSDVVLLMKKNIIGNFLGSTQRLANMFIEMRDGLFLDRNDHYLVKVYKKINKHC
ncbi:hypothetical protein ZOSMA_5G00120 [Zostera marina]|uniref:Uncharacterized protein n=1 Tax=Zostera marina TaxID=29655 RepID=A0A0K9NVS4_ZOSMR|nr:hypothetical protein ZOSMA_5G00120 [Zostera marina]